MYVVVPPRLAICSPTLVQALCSRLGHAQHFHLVHCRAHCFPMGHRTLGSPRHYTRSAKPSIAFDQVYSTTLTECDTTSGHHHVHHEKGDEETASSSSDCGPDSMYGQFISIAILEFGVVLHSVLVGLTLAVDENFVVLFIVLVFHRQLLSPL